MKKIILIGIIVTVLIAGGIGISANASVEKAETKNKTEDTAVLENKENGTNAMETDDTASGKNKDDADKKTAKKAEKAVNKTTEVNANADKPAKTAVSENQTVANTQVEPVETVSNTQEATTSAPATPAKPTTEAHQHSWTTVTDKEAWDEPVYEEQPIYDVRAIWRDGTICEMTCEEKVNWCMQHCTTCFPGCPSPDPQGRCAFADVFSDVICIGTEKVQTGTTHHPAVTHQECKTCGARK